MGRPGEVTYTIKRVDSDAEQINVHADHLKKYHHPNPWKNERWMEDVLFWNRDVEENSTEPVNHEEISEPGLNVNALVFTPAQNKTDLDEILPYQKQVRFQLPNVEGTVLPCDDTVFGVSLSQYIHPYPGTEIPQLQRPVRKMILPAKFKDYTLE